MESMLALVKNHRGPGLALESVPVPSAGPGEVVIRVLKTAICGTDVHIYEWDEWAQRTIPVPLIVGHEFVGGIVELGRRGARSRARGAGRPARATSSAATAATAAPAAATSARNTVSIGVDRSRRVRRVPRAPGGQRLAGGRADPARHSSPSSIRSATPCTRRCRSTWSARTCSSPAPGRSAAWRRPIVTPRRRAARRHHRREPDAAGHRREDGRVAGRRRAHVQPRRGDGRPGHDGGLRRRPRDVRQQGALRDMIAAMAHGGHIGLLGFLEGETPVDWNASSSAGSRSRASTDARCSRPGTR